MKGEPIVILLVEDNSDHAELIMRCFEEHKIANKVYHLTDGEAAMNYLGGKNVYSDRNIYPMPNLILLDLRLPKIDGLQVLMNIRNTDYMKNIPVVILTSSENEKDIFSAYSNHVNSYLVKPVDYEKFNRLMDELGFYWLGWNKAPY
jgi:CheY-like chemotaxis protein